MTKVRFERRIEAPIELVWRHLTDPALMNAWSVAPVELAVGNDPWQPGSERTVRVRRFGVPLTLREEVVAVDAPDRYEYRVRPNAVVRRHHAIQDLARVDGGTRVTWSVDIRSWLPGLMAPLVRSMRGQLEASLDALVRECESAG